MALSVTMLSGCIFMRPAAASCQMAPSRHWFSNRAESGSSGSQAVLPASSLLMCERLTQPLCRVRASPEWLPGFSVFAYGCLTTIALAA